MTIVVTYSWKEQKNEDVTYSDMVFDDYGSEGKKCYVMYSIPSSD